MAIKPQALTMDEAASIPLVGLTAWQVLIERAHLQKGQRVLIHAARVVWARLPFGWRSMQRDGGDDHEHGQRGSGQSLWADVVIDYKKEDVARVLRDRDYDVVLQSLDKVTFEKSLRVRAAAKLRLLPRPQ